MFTSEQLAKFSTDQLMAMHKGLVSEIKRRRSNEAYKAVQTLSVGQIVTFASRKKGRDITIRIDKINMKNVIGQEVDPATRKPNMWSVRWTVDASICRPVGE